MKEVEEVKEEIKEKVEEEEPVVEDYDPELTRISIEVAPIYYLDSIESSSFTVRLLDQKDKTFENGFTGEMVIKALNGEVRPSRPIVTGVDFRNGVLKNSFAKYGEGQDRIEVVLNGETYRSDWFDIIGTATASFSDVSVTDQSFQAINYLFEEGIVSGYPDGSFKPDKVVSRVEALKLILEGIDASFDTGNLPFADAYSSEWYAKYVYTAYKNNIVAGYPDGTFKPSSTVNRAEFYKILFNSMGVQVDSVVKTAPFKDVPVDAWFAPYIATAKDMGIVEGDYFYPENGMKRADVAEAIYKVMIAVGD